MNNDSIKTFDQLANFKNTPHHGNLSFNNVDEVYGSFKLRFSIITVCRNSEKVLPRAVASLQTQNFGAYEWIVIDGASTDGTLQVVKSFTAARTHVISEPDSGIYDAMNKGLRAASGEYIFFLNSDDSLHDDSVLADIDEALTKQSDPDFIFGQVVNVRADGHWLRDFSHINSENILYEGICHQAIFARRQLFSTIGDFNQKFRINADYDWIIRVFQATSRCISVNRRVAFFVDGGAHSLDKLFLAEERKEVRLQYVSRIILKLNLFWIRLRGRIFRELHGHAQGATLLTNNTPAND